MNADRSWRMGIAIGATLIAFVSARPYAGSWNDGSRLATVESLVERRTMIIDESIFVVPIPVGQPTPYHPDDPFFHGAGTKDKLFIHGHYYSDKSPVPAFQLAAIYAAYRWLGGPPAAERPDWFCQLMTWTASGIAYAVACLCIFAIGRRCRLSPRQAGWLTIFFGLGTTALPYVQHVNNHILLLAVAAGLFLQLVIGDAEGWSLPRLLTAGTLAGIAYTIDLGAGPPLALLTLAYLGWRTRSLRCVGAVLAALPWIAWHHIVNYDIGGTIGPANAVRAYLDWPSSPFTDKNITGGWAHPDPFKAIVYAFDMLLGKKGFYGHNLPLFLVVLSMPMLVRTKYPERCVTLLGVIWGIGVWLLYAATSTNMSGGCCSIRWFVPLLAPSFLAVAIVVREQPRRWRELTILGCGGLLLGIGMAIRGPWFLKLMPFYVIIYPATVVSWLMVRFHKSATRSINIDPTPTNNG